MSLSSRFHNLRFDVLLVIDANIAAQSSHESSVVLVDIRSASSWSDGVPANAQLWSEAELLKQAKQLKQADKKVYIVCYRGQTSAKLACSLASTGFTYR